MKSPGGSHLGEETTANQSPNQQKGSGRLKLGTTTPPSFTSMAPSPHSLLCPAQNQPTCCALPELGRLLTPGTGHGERTFLSSPQATFGKERPGNNHKTVVTHCFCQRKESLLPNAPLLPPGITTKTTTPTSKEVMQGCEAGILTCKIQEWWERAASLTASASLAC